MAVDNKNIIDAISIDKNNRVVLTISDHLEWDKENTHLIILQDKINAYFDILESKEIYNIYPDSKNKEIAILLYIKHLPNKDGKKFLKIVEDFLNNSGYSFNFYHLTDSE